MEGIKGTAVIYKEGELFSIVVEAGGAELEAMSIRNVSAATASIFLAGVLVNDNISVVETEEQQTLGADLVVGFMGEVMTEVMRLARSGKLSL